MSQCILYSEIIVLHSYGRNEQKVFAFFQPAVRIIVGNGTPLSLAADVAAALVL